LKPGIGDAGVNLIFQAWQRVKDNAIHLVSLANAKT
jgi:hypothetical protein